jgi:hypothetical protein
VLSAVNRATMARMNRSGTTYLGIAALVAACGDVPANVAGDYQGTLTNQVNSCPGTWTTGQASDVTFRVTQSGSVVNVVGTGAAEVLLRVLLGSNTFAGTITGSRIRATLLSTNTYTRGQCMFSLRADLDAGVNGNMLEGVITYRPELGSNPHPDCASMGVTGCMGTQAAVGMRTAGP